MSISQSQLIQSIGSKMETLQNNFVALQFEKACSVFSAGFNCFADKMMKAYRKEVNKNFEVHDWEDRRFFFHALEVADSAIAAWATTWFEQNSQYGLNAATFQRLRHIVLKRNKSQHDIPSTEDFRESLACLLENDEISLPDAGIVDHAFALL